MINFLAQSGVESRPVFYPIPDMPPYQGYGIYPVASRISKGGISLPSGFNLTSSEQDYVIELIQKYLRLIKESDHRTLYCFTNL